MTHEAPVLDPRKNGGFLNGKEIVLGKPTKPSPEFPGIEVIPFTFATGSEKKGTLLTMPQGSITPIELFRGPSPVGKSQEPESDITHFALNGTGTLLIATPKDQIIALPLQSERGAYSIGPDTRVAVAAITDFVGVRIMPNIITSETLPQDDLRAPVQMWEIYNNSLAA